MKPITSKELLEILMRNDPMSIVLKKDDGTYENPDEYEPEVMTIRPKLKNAHSTEDVHEIVYKEFVRWFSVTDSKGNRVKKSDEEIVGSKEKYLVIANEILKKMKE